MVVSNGQFNMSIRNRRSGMDYTETSHRRYTASSPVEFVSMECFMERTSRLAILQRLRPHLVFGWVNVLQNSPRIHAHGMNGSPSFGGYDGSQLPLDYMIVDTPTSHCACTDFFHLPSSIDNGHKPQNRRLVPRREHTKYHLNLT